MKELREITKEIISFNTEGPPTKELPLAKWIKGFLEDLGIEAKLQKVAPGRANVIAKIGRGKGAGLLLSGHIDVVLAGELELWTVTHPFEPIVKEGKLYGRGACDMKGGVACILDAVKELSNENFKKQLTLVFTSGEDTGGWFVNEVVAQGEVTTLDARFGLIPEPTTLKIVRCHKGNAATEITIYGKAAHSSVPEVGVNAITKAAKLLVALEGVKRELEVVRHPLLGYTTIESTIIKGGIKTNIIPDRCDIYLNWRLIPIHARGDVIKRILGRVMKECRSSDPDFNAEITKIRVSPPLEIPEGNELVKLMKRILGSEPIGAPYYTEAVTYTQAGIPTLICGPGNIRQAHTFNEYIDLEELEMGKRLMIELIRKICL